MSDLERRGAPAGLVDGADEQGLEGAVLVFIHHHRYRYLALLAERGGADITKLGVALQIGVGGRERVDGLLELLDVVDRRRIGLERLEDVFEGVDLGVSVCPGTY